MFLTQTVTPKATAVIERTLWTELLRCSST
jgi:hypothetical protein